MLHCIPFLAAAAAGAAIAYVAKDPEARNRIRDGADKIADGVRDGIDRTARAARALTRSRASRVARETGSDAAPIAH